MRGYLGKFFPFYEFKNGIGAGFIAMFVGIIEFLLELVKPLTLSMRLFGNIYGGEVALGVDHGADRRASCRSLLLRLEFMLNLIQALIFSVLTLMYIVLAIEDHGHEEGHIAEEAMRRRRPRSAGRDAHRAGMAVTNQASSAPHARVALNQTQTSSIASPRRRGDKWSTLAQVLRPWASSALASASASWRSWPPARSGATPMQLVQIRGLAIILAAFAEGLGVLAIVVGLLAIFISCKRSSRGPAGFSPA